MTPHPARARARRLLLLGGLLALASCGGGGGGGGGDGGGTPIGGGGGPTAGATFDGFSFRTGPSSAPNEFTTPPVEDLSASPPKIGAPLDLVVVFHFDPSDSPPAGPFTQTSLPVFTTPGQMPAEAVPPNVSLVAAKGTYVQVDPHTIEFRPFLPQDPLSINPASSPDSIPGFIPGATYTAKVETTPGLKISNLVGPGGSVEFGITTLPGGFFSDSGDDLPPTLVSSFPPDGASDFYPGLFSNTPAGGDEQTFQPHGPATIDLVYDHGVAPTVENLDGRDWNGDGLTDPNFFLRCRASKLLVSHTVPAGAFNGGEPEFAALSGLDEDAGAPGLVVNPNGLDIFMHNSGGPFSGPGQDPALVAAPVALAAGADPSLTFALFAGAGDDSLTVIDHTLGDDPGPARIAAAAVTVPLDDGVGLITLLDGRLVAFDRTTRKIVELQPVVTRSLPLGVPTLESVSVGFTSAAFPALDVRDLAQAPSGALYALAVSGGGSNLVPLTPIDFDTNGSFDAGDGLPSGAAAIPLPSSGPYEGFEFLTETTALALQREADAVDQIDLPSLTAQRVVSDLAGFDTLDPGDPSPARAIVVAHMQLDVGVDLIDNQTARSEFLIDPLSVLPPSTAFDLMQRPNLASLGGISEANADSDAPGYVLGAKRLMSFRTADPANTRAECGEPDPEGRVHDVLQEEFVDQTLQDPNPTTLNPQADWGGESPGGQSSGRLTAVAGQAGGIQLGDFRPLPFPDFVADSGYSGAPGAVNNASWRILFLDTDVQHFPLPDGSTPGVTSSTTVVGGKFNFHDVVIPEGVWIMARGSKPLQITATGRVEIAGLIDASGGDGLSDSSFDTGFLPVPGGHGGPGGGRGGDAQPTLWNPKFAALISIQQTGQQAAQYVTPETAETGLGPVIGPTGNVSFLSVGGRGGLSTLGYDPNPAGYTKLNPSGDNTEYHRPPGGGGGTFYLSGDQAHVGSGGYRVQSNGTWPPYSKCPNQDWIRDAVYGNEEIKLLPLQFQVPSLQCVYLQGTPAAPEYFQPGGLPGDLVFKDGDFSNDYIGPGGEVPVLIGGQGGGGGGTRIDSFNSAIWACGSRTGFPCAFPQQPHYPALNFSNIYWSPSLFDAKGGGGGGGGGAVLIRAFGEIRLTRMGHIDASGGSGQGGEIVGNSNYSGGGGGGSGGAIVLQAGGDIILEADPQHRTPGFVDSSLAQGAALDVSGGIGYDASESPDDLASAPKSDHTVGRSDGGCGGFGLIQLQTGGPTGAPRIAQGAFAFARQQLQVKLGGWNGGSNLNQREHNEWTATAGPNNVLRYIDMLEHRAFLYDPDATAAGGLGDPPVMTSTHLPWLVLQGSDPPIVTPSATVPPLPLQLDSVMVEHYGRRVVRDPKPEAIMASYFGYDPLTFKETNWCLACSPPKYLNNPPGELYAPTDEIPLSRFLNRPDGTPLKQDPTTDNPFAEFAHTSTIDRLPVVPLHKVPPAIGAVSQGTSKWLDFNGVALRARDASGLTPPLFLGIHGTYNALLGTPPPGKEAQIVLGGPVSSPPGDTPAHHVDNTGDYPFDPGLCPDAEPTGSGPPFNDIKVDSPDYGLDNVVTDNAKVTLEFQGAFAIRAGSRVPDPATLTGWVSDVRDLSGYPLVRFRVTFDLGHNPSYPFSPDSKKPGVDTVRVRAKY